MAKKGFVKEFVYALSKNPEALKNIGRVSDLKVFLKTGKSWDDIVRLIGEKGPDFIRVYAAYGDDVVDVLLKCGSDAIYNIRLYQKPFIDMVLKHGDAYLMLCAAHGAEVVEVCVKYGDELFKLVKTHGDDFIPYVMKYTDVVMDGIRVYDAKFITLLVKHKDLFVRMYQTYQDDAVKIFAEYGDELLNLPESYREEATELVVRFGEKVLRGIKTHGDDFMKKYADEKDGFIQEYLEKGDGVFGGSVEVKLTEPTLPIGGKPKGNYEPSRPGIDGIPIERQNYSADLLAAHGYDIEMLPEKVGGNGYGITSSSNPDYLIDGEAFDCFSPEGSRARNVWSTVMDKTETQAERIILNLDGYQGSLDELYSQFMEWEIPTLKELIVIKNETIVRWLPR